MLRRGSGYPTLTVGRFPTQNNESVHSENAVIAQEEERCDLNPSASRTSFSCNQTGYTDVEPFLLQSPLLSPSPAVIFQKCTFLEEHFNLDVTYLMQTWTNVGVLAWAGTRQGCDVSAASNSVLD